MIRPLDLQMLFMNMDKVGKEQAQTRESVALQQAAHAQKIAKDDEIATHGVVEIAPSKDEGQEIKTEVHKDEVPQRRPGKKLAKKAEAEPEPEADPTWKDPKLGTHIDLSG